MLWDGIVSAMKHNSRDKEDDQYLLQLTLRSDFLHRLTAMAPASTKYLRQRSSMPPVVRMTLAPVFKIFSILSYGHGIWSLVKRENKKSLKHGQAKNKNQNPSSLTQLLLTFVMSDSLCLMDSSLEGSLTRTWMPSLSFSFWREKSRQATLAPVIFFFMAEGKKVCFKYKCTHRKFFKKEDTKKQAQICHKSTISNFQILYTHTHTQGIQIKGTVPAYGGSEGVGWVKFS